MNTVVELENVSVRYGRKVVLQELSCSMSSFCVGLLGPNGAGKTTLLRTLLGFIPVFRGSGTVLGYSLRQRGHYYRHEIGYMPEEDCFIPNVSAVRFVRLMAELSGLPADDAMERAHEALFLVGLGETRYRKIETFSKGMKQRIKLAQAIVHSPKLLLLDEPTSGFDPTGRIEILNLIRDIVAKKICHVLLSTHLLSDVEEICDHVLVLNKGNIVLDQSLIHLRKKEHPILELRVRGDIDPFITALTTHGIECALNRNKKLKLVLPENMPPTDIFRIADQQHIRILELIPQRDSLEEMFFQALERTNGTL